MFRQFPHCFCLSCVRCVLFLSLFYSCLRVHIGVCDPVSPSPLSGNRSGTIFDSEPVHPGIDPEQIHIRKLFRTTFFSHRLLGPRPRRSRPISTSKCGLLRHRFSLVLLLKLGKSRTVNPRSDRNCQSLSAPRALVKMSVV